MNLIIEEIIVSPGIPIETLELSDDRRFCFVWSKGSKMHIIKDTSVSLCKIMIM